MNKLHLIWIIPVAALFVLFLTRLFSHTEIDDISPGIFCEQKYLEKADVLWVIPEFENRGISENKRWCKEILNLNKTLGLHGFSHEYKEFGDDFSEEKLKEGILEFEACFNEAPKMFKAPQLVLSERNKVLLEKYNLFAKGKVNQLTHKVYHCEDESKFSKGLFPNWFIDLF